MKNIIIKMLVGILDRLDACWIYSAEGDPSLFYDITKDNIKEISKKYGITKAHIGTRLHIPIHTNLVVKFREVDKIEAAKDLLKGLGYKLIK